MYCSFMTVSFWDMLSLEDASDVVKVPRCSNVFSRLDSREYRGEFMRLTERTREKERPFVDEVCDLCWNASIGFRTIGKNDIFCAPAGIVFRWKIVGKCREPVSRVLNDHFAMIYVPKVTIEDRAFLKYLATGKCVKLSIRSCSLAR